MQCRRLTKNPHYVPDYELCYANEDLSRRCSWGWIDKSLTHIHTLSFSGLREHTVGMAAQVTINQVQFVNALMGAHDLSWDPDQMLKRLRRVAENFNLNAQAII